MKTEGKTYLSSGGVKSGSVWRYIIRTRAVFFEVEKCRIVLQPKKRVRKAQYGGRAESFYPSSSEIAPSQTKRRKALFFPLRSNRRLQGIVGDRTRQEKERYQDEDHPKPGKGELLCHL